MVCLMAAGLPVGARAGARAGVGAAAAGAPRGGGGCTRVLARLACGHAAPAYGWGWLPCWCTQTVHRHALAQPRALDQKVKCRGALRPSPPQSIGFGANVGSSSSMADARAKLKQARACLQAKEFTEAIAHCKAVLAEDAACLEAYV